MGVIERWRDVLPVGPETPDLTLGEGATPLVLASRFSEQLGLEVWLKLEGANPTGSFKDRGMAVAVAKAVEEGATGVVCASTGNTAASAAAYAARAGVEALVFHPAGAVSGPKEAQARIAGARIVTVPGSFESAFEACAEVGRAGSHHVVNSINPYRIAGQKTAALEICAHFGRAPDVLALPYGGGGNTCAYAAGFAEAERGKPTLVAVEAADRPGTVASAIRIGEPVHAAEVEALGATVLAADDEEILSAWAELAQLEGVFCEPASVAGLVGLRRLAREHAWPDGALAVCVLTGSGLKDTTSVDLVVPAHEQLEAAS